MRECIDPRNITCESLPIVLDPWRAEEESKRQMLDTTRYEIVLVYLDPGTSVLLDGQRDRRVS